MKQLVVLIPRGLFCRVVHRDPEKWESTSWKFILLYRPRGRRMSLCCMIFTSDAETTERQVSGTICNEREGYYYFLIVVEAMQAAVDALSLSRS